MTRRSFVKLSSGLLVPAAAANAQKGALLAQWPCMVMYRGGSGANFLTFTKTGAVLAWKWWNGTITRSNYPNPTFPSGLSVFRVFSPDGWLGVTGINWTSVVLRGIPWNLALNCKNLTSFTYYANYDLAFGMPSFAPCTALTSFTIRQTDLNSIPIGCFNTQANLATIHLGTNSLPAAMVNRVLASLVVSLALPGRVTCTVTLNGGTNAAPTGQGATDKQTLIDAGWTVTTT
jgi:hypothetical protein